MKKEFEFYGMKEEQFLKNSEEKDKKEIIKALKHLDKIQCLYKTDGELIRGFDRCDIDNTKESCNGCSHANNLNCKRDNIIDGVMWALTGALFGRIMDLMEGEVMEYTKRDCRVYFNLCNKYKHLSNNFKDWTPNKDELSVIR